MIGAPPFVTAVVLTLAWFAAVNAVASALAAIAAPSCGERVVGAGTRARRLALLRLGPSGVAALVAGAVFLPAHLRLEPPVSEEQLGLWSFAAAGCGAALVIRSAVRFLAAWRESRRMPGEGSRATQRGRVPLIEVPLLSGLALAGIIRPRILVGSRIKRVLTSAEMQVAVAHELAHRHAGDNLTRVLMRCAPDFLGGTRPGRRLERLWAGEAECAADAAAVRGDASRATSLASALVKIGRLAAGEREWAAGLSTLHHPALLELRVRRLVSGSGNASPSPRWIYAAAAIGAAAAGCAWLIGLPAALHWLTESLLHH